MKRVLVIAGGGTGGHLFPGIALAEEFTDRRDGWDVIFVGPEKRLEERILPKLGFEFATIPSAPLKGRGWWDRTVGIGTLVRGVLISLWLLHRISPQLVVGLGGYSSGPVLLAAYLLGIKRVIQEQNVYPGLANRAASRLSQLVFLSWGQGATYFPTEKTRVTGNPVRKAVLAGRAQQRAGQGFTLFVLGGSQGSTAINRAMVGALNNLAEIKGDLIIIHQTGERDYAWVKAAYEHREFRAFTYAFIDDMAPHYREAHLVVCRAGATTLAELCAWGRAAILIPYSYASDDHQRKNAQVLVDSGAATMIPEAKLTEERLAREIITLYSERSALEMMEKKAFGLGRPDAAALIVDECYRLMGLN